MSISHHPAAAQVVTAELRDRKGFTLLPSRIRYKVPSPRIVITGHCYDNHLLEVLKVHGHSWLILIHRKLPPSFSDLCSEYFCLLGWISVIFQLEINGLIFWYRISEWTGSKESRNVSKEWRSVKCLSQLFITWYLIDCFWRHLRAYWNRRFVLAVNQHFTRKGQIPNNS